MSSKLNMAVFSALAGLLVLAACGGNQPTQEPQVVKQTVVTKETVVVEKVVTREVEKVVTKEVEKVVKETVIVEVTPTPSTPITTTQEVTGTVSAGGEAKDEGKKETANLLATFTITHPWDLNEGIEIHHVVFTYTVEIVTGTLHFSDPISPAVVVEKTYGYLTAVREGEVEPRLKVVIDDQALANLMFIWAQKRAAGQAPDFNVDCRDLHWVFRDERDPASGNNLSFSKHGGLDINEQGDIELKFDGVRPRVGLIPQAVLLGPNQANYGEALEKAAIKVWAYYHDQQRLFPYEELGVYDKF